MKNHAFIMPVHNQPNLLARIVSLLSAPNHFFFINVDGKCSNRDEFINLFKDDNHVVFIEPPVKVYHAGISQVYATLEMLNSVISHPIHFDYVHQTSGQDYPLRSIEQFDAFFEATNESFMCYTYEKDIEKMLDYRCTQGWHFNNNDTIIAKAYLKLKLDVLSSYIVRRKSIDVFSPTGIWGGWDWWSWSESVYMYVMNYLDSHPDYLKRFDHTHAPCEIFFHTMLYPKIEELSIRKHYPLHYVSWVPHRPVDTSYRPFTLDERDFEYVTKSPCFFCRKVDERQSEKLLDMIDQQRNNPFDITAYSAFI